MVMLKLLAKLLAGEAGTTVATEEDAAAQARRLERFDARLAEMLEQRADILPSGNQTARKTGLDGSTGLQEGAVPPPNAATALGRARQRPILFRQLYPPPPSPGRSFYGGIPVGPAAMAWPRDPRDGSPMTPVLQVDAAALAEQDATGLLPKDGALYLFSNLGWGEDMSFRFVHMADDGRDWIALPVPEDLPPAFGKEGAALSPLSSYRVPLDRQDPPRLLPCWPFVPVGIDYPVLPGDSEDGSDIRFWAEAPAVKEVVLRAQDPFATPGETGSERTPPFARPFAGFPHDWAAVRVVAAAALDGMACISWRRFLPDADEPTREALAERWRQEALALYDDALGHRVGAVVPQQRADEIWQRIAALEPVFWPMFQRVVDNAVNVSLGLGSDGVGAIPADRIEALASWHVLGTVRMREEYAHEFTKAQGLDLPHQQATRLYEQARAAGALKRIRDVWAPTPNRMFGPPSYVQGYVEDLVGEWLLLLELSSSETIGLPMGDGVLQFVIRPEDLAERRFDRVRAITTGY